jgi:hypothetical protein
MKAFLNEIESVKRRQNQNPKREKKKPKMHRHVVITSSQEY